MTSKTRIKEGIQDPNVHNNELVHDPAGGIFKIHNESDIINSLLIIVKEGNKFLESFQCRLEIVDNLDADDVFHPHRREYRQSLSEFSKISDFRDRSINSSELSVHITNSVI